MIELSTPAVREWTRQLFAAMGCDEREADLTAHHLVEANLTGHDSHGIGMTPRYVSSWLADELQLNQHVTVERDHGSMLTLDGHWGMGQAVTEEAMALAIGRAKEHGSCILGLKNAHHLGRVGHWAEQATSAGLVSVHFVNACSYPVVAPHGGSEARLVTNPFTVGIPVPGHEPILLDFATSAIAMGKVRVAFNKGEALPPDSVLDAEGRSTRDAGVMFPAAGERRGAILPFAGHKGFALGMVCELLAAALTGGPTTRPARLTMQHAVWNNMLAVVFDPARVGSLEAFAAEFEESVAWMRSARLAEGSEGVLLPGEPERISRAKRALHLPVDAGTLKQLDEAAEKVMQAQGSGPGPLSTFG